MTGETVKYLTLLPTFLLKGIHSPFPTDVIISYGRKVWKASSVGQNPAQKKHEDITKTLIWKSFSLKCHNWMYLKTNLWKWVGTTCIFSPYPILVYIARIKRQRNSMRALMIEGESPKVYFFMSTYLCTTGVR